MRKYTIEELLITHHMSQSMLVRAIGCSEGSASRWVRGMAMQRASKEAVAEYFGILPDEIENAEAKDGRPFKTKNRPRHSHPRGRLGKPVTPDELERRKRGLRFAHDRRRRERMEGQS